VAKHKTSSPRIPPARHVRSGAPGRVGVSRAEHNGIIAILNERNIILNGLREALTRLEQSDAVQFKRIAQLQADFDAIKRAWEHVKSVT
jgi:hypothetical protein